MLILLHIVVIFLDLCQCWEAASTVTRKSFELNVQRVTSSYWTVPTTVECALVGALRWTLLDTSGAWRTSFRWPIGDVPVDESARYASPMRSLRPLGRALRNWRRTSKQPTHAWQV